MDYCGYCKEDPCGCNGFGGPKGVSRAEQDAKCGYCKSPLFEFVEIEEGKGVYKATPCECNCDGFGGEK